MAKQKIPQQRTSKDYAVAVELIRLQDSMRERNAVGILPTEPERRMAHHLIGCL